MKNLFLNKKIFKLLFIGLFFALPTFASDVILYPEPMVSLHSTGDTFILEARLDPGDQCVNVAKVDLVYPQRVLEAVDFSDGGSALTLWVQPATIDDETGRVSFAGGIPGGYCGENSISLGTVVFRTKEIENPAEARIRFSATSRVFLSDGTGGEAQLTRREASIVISPDMPRPLIDLWQERVQRDKTAPEITLLDIRRDPQLFSGRYFLMVTAADQLSGISHYEVSERRVLGFLPIERAEWRRVELPHALEDQSLRSMVSVKVVDKAGNERIETVRPPVGWQDILPWAFILALIGLVWWKNKPLKSDDDYQREEERQGDGDKEKESHDPHRVD